MERKSSDAKDAPPKKMKFAPKIPPRKIPKPVEVKREAREDEDTLNQELLKRVKEGFGRSGQKVERKSAPVQVAFGYGAESISARLSGSLRGPSSSGSKSNSSGARHIGGPISHNDGNGSVPKMKKEYVEPWDYYSYYPITLPLRRPYSGNPERRDEQEFGEASVDFDEARINPAVELGLTGNEEGQMLLFQLPPSLPLIKRLASRKGKEIVDASKPPPRGKNTSEKASSLEDLPAGFMGKMLVYKSGAVKMKLGDILFDVTPGMNCVFAQDVAAINVEEKHCCILGELNKRAIVTAEVDSLIDGITKLD